MQFFTVTRRQFAPHRSAVADFYEQGCNNNLNGIYAANLSKRYRQVIAKPDVPIAYNMIMMIGLWYLKINIIVNANISMYSMTIVIWTCFLSGMGVRTPGLLDYCS